MKKEIEAQAVKWEDIKAMQARIEELEKLLDAIEKLLRKVK